jgi:hypothetical protein
MLLMSDDLSDRIVLTHDEEDDGQVTTVTTADVTFYLDGSHISIPLKKMCLATDEITLSFTAVPALPIMLHQNEGPVKCVVTAGHHVLDFDLKNCAVTWDNTEGKQLCTIVNRLEQHARRSE